MADSALTQIFGGNTQASHAGGGVGAAVAAPVAAASSVANAGAHVTILGLLAFLILMWVLIRIARFRFVITTGIGR